MIMGEMKEEVSGDRSLGQKAEHQWPTDCAESVVISCLPSILLQKASTEELVTFIRTYDQGDLSLHHQAILAWSLKARTEAILSAGFSHSQVFNINLPALVKWIKSCPEQYDEDDFFSGDSSAYVELFPALLYEFNIEGFFDVASLSSSSLKNAPQRYAQIAKASHLPNLFGDEGLRLAEKAPWLVASIDLELNLLTEHRAVIDRVSNSDTFARLANLYAYSRLNDDGSTSFNVADTLTCLRFWSDLFTETPGSEVFTDHLISELSEYSADDLEYILELLGRPSLVGLSSPTALVLTVSKLVSVKPHLLTLEELLDVSNDKLSELGVVRICGNADDATHQAVLLRDIVPIIEQTPPDKRMEMLAIFFDARFPTSNIHFLRNPPPWENLLRNHPPSESRFRKLPPIQRELWRRFFIAENSRPEWYQNHSPSILDEMDKVMAALPNGEVLFERFPGLFAALTRAHTKVEQGLTNTGFTELAVFNYELASTRAARGYQLIRPNLNANIESFSKGGRRSDQDLYSLWQQHLKGQRPEESSKALLCFLDDAYQSMPDAAVLANSVILPYDPFKAIGSLFEDVLPYSGTSDKRYVVFATPSHDELELVPDLARFCKERGMSLVMGIPSDGAHPDRFRDLLESKCQDLRIGVRTKREFSTDLFCDFRADTLLPFEDLDLCLLATVGDQARFFPNSQVTILGRNRNIFEAIYNRPVLLCGTGWNLNVYAFQTATELGHAKIIPTTPSAFLAAIEGELSNASRTFSRTHLQRFVRENDLFLLRDAVSFLERKVLRMSIA